MADETARAYYDEYWSREAPPPLADPLSPTRARLLGRALAEAGARRVLDVGAGAGDLVAALGADGFDAVGMDVSPAAVERASARHPGGTFLVHSVEDVPWPVDDGSFDCVVAFEVIEHLLRPRRLLEGAARALGPGGHVALTTPYHGRVKNVALSLLGFDRHFAVEGDHVRFFSDAALCRLLRDTGFEPVRLEHFGRAPVVWAGVFVWARRVS
jgi:2-polyprenyl-3-methyl-5-hydroxy-6-metoxy-1,4-benzoquinol methylase